MISQIKLMEDAVKLTILLKVPRNQKFEIELNFQVKENHA